jgi:hypothetical protein
MLPDGGRVPAPEPGRLPPVAAGPAAPLARAGPARPAPPPAPPARPVALPREQPQGQHEVDPDPGGQPPLGGPGICQQPVHQLERDHLRQLTQMPRGEHPRRHRDRLRDGRDSSADGRLNA